MRERTCRASHGCGLNGALLEWPLGPMACPWRLHVVGGEAGEGVGGGFFKASEAAAEDEFYGFGGTVALLGDAQFGGFAFFGRGTGLEEVGAVNEHDHVGVLLNGAGFTQ